MIIIQKRWRNINRNKQKRYRKTQNKKKILSRDK